MQSWLEWIKDFLYPAEVRIPRFPDRRDVGVPVPEIVGMSDPTAHPILAPTITGDPVAATDWFDYWAKLDLGISVLAPGSSPVPLTLQPAPTAVILETMVASTPEEPVAHFFEGLADIALSAATQQFAPEMVQQPATVLQFPAAPGTAQTGIYAPVRHKKRRRRRRLLTATDKCDITYMQQTLSPSAFKVWLANPSCFTKG